MQTLADVLGIAVERPVAARISASEVEVSLSTVIALNVSSVLRVV